MRPTRTRLTLLLAAAVAICDVGVGQPAPQSNEAPAATQPSASQPAATQAPESAPAEAKPLEESAPTDLTPESIRARIQQLESSTEMQDTVRIELLSLYRQALEQLLAFDSWQTKAAELEKGRHEAPALLEAARRRQAEAASQPSGPPILDVPADATLEQLTQRLKEAEAALANRQESAKKLEDEAQHRNERRVAIPDLLKDANERLAAATKEASAAPDPSASPQLTLARRAAALARKKQIEQEVKAYQEELRYYDARNDLLAARRAEAAQAVTQAAAVSSAWQALAQARREEEARRLRAEAEAELRRASPAVRDLADKSSKLAQEVEALAEKIKVAQQEKQEVEALTQEFDRSLKTLIRNVGTPGMGQAIGPLMRRMQSQLAELRKYERDFAKRVVESGQIALKQNALDEEKKDVSDVDAYVDGLLAEHEKSHPGADTAALRPRVREIADLYSRTLAQAATATNAYRSDVTDLRGALSTIIAKTREAAAYVEEHVLWIPSSAPIYAAKLTPETAPSLGALRVAPGVLVRDAQARPGLYVGLALALLVRFVAVRRLRTIGYDEQQRRWRAETLSHSVSLLARDVLAPLPLPLVLWFVGSRLARAAEVDEALDYSLGLAIGAGLSAAAFTVWTLGVLRRVCLAKGLGETHFRWDGRALRQIRHDATWMLATLAPAVFVIAATEQYSESDWRDTIGRVALLVAMAAYAIFFFRALRPATGIFGARLRKRPTGWLSQLRYLWFPALVAIPIALAIASALGYHYTAVQLAKRVAITIRIVMAVAIVYALLVRGVLLQQRRIAIELARKKKEAEEGEAPAPVEDLAGGLDLLKIGDQTRRLLSTVVAFGLLLGLWFTWSSMLPALSFLQKIELWKYTVETTQAGGDGAAAAAVKSIETITLAHLSLALIIAAVTYALARNLPGVLEITLLQRLPLDTGGRYAFTAIMRYLITALGIVVAFGAIGVGWAQVQWLVAAVSLGLAFGLQEIFANFVAGLILLFERPIRVGDTVTVGDISGTVTRIRIRATTITDWDRKELVIPNREFVTGQVVNWTLTDTVLRVTVPVGIAYKSDPRRAERLLYEVARQCEFVMDDPAPRVLFQGFGDSALSFELRVFVDGLDHLLDVRHELHNEIHRVFKEHDIEIAFPQLDLHVRAIEPALRVEQRGGAAGGRPLVDAPEESVPR